jgi:DNA adenine methylase
MYSNSFLKWAGGKKNVLNELFKHIPKEGKVWVEPFLGSATVALNTNYDRYILNDYNSDLIHLFKMVVNDPGNVLSKSNELFVPGNNNRSAFESLRNEYNMSADPDLRAILFMYLNRHCYNGLMRYNSSGEFNCSFGQYHCPAIAEKALLQFSTKFKHAKFVCGSYKNLKFNRGEGVTVYNDPPYLPLTPTASFCAYTKHGFKKNEHVLLDERCLYLSKGGCDVWVSNHDVNILGECYKNASTTWKFMVTRTISRKKDNRVPAKEVLMNY